MTPEELPSSIPATIGEVLAAVAFVHDYVEFHFNGPVLRSFTNPEVEVSGRTHVFPKAGSRDALCSVIGRRVERVRIDEGRAIEIFLSGDATLRVPLTAIVDIGAEAASFVLGENQPVEEYLARYPDEGPIR